METNDLKEQIEKLPDDTSDYPKCPLCGVEMELHEPFKDPISNSLTAWYGQCMNTECGIETHAFRTKERLVEWINTRAHTALEQRVAQYEEMLEGAKELYLDGYFLKRHSELGWRLYNGNHFGGVSVTEYLPTALLAWNALKNGGGDEI